MNLSYRDNKALGPGNGILEFSEGLPPPGPWSISILRASDQKYATAQKGNPWVGETFFVPLEGHATDNGTLELFIGPDIVDTLDQQEQYKVTVKGEDGETASARLKLGTITRSRGHALGNMAQNTPPATEKTLNSAIQPAPVAEPEVTPLPELPTPQPQASKESAATGKKTAARILLLALLVALCGAWFIFDYLHKNNEEAAATTQQATSGAEAAASTPPKMSAEGSSSQQRTSQSAEEQVRQFFVNAQGGKASPASAAALAARLPKNDKSDQDAVYRLYYFAAENGEPAALMEYAACLDPAKPQWGSIDKDAPLALEVYKKAATANMAGAAEAQQALLAWLQSEAQNGNSKAIKWLEQLKQ